MSKTLINGADGVANWSDINFHCFIFSDDWNDMPCSSLFLLSGNFSRIYRPLIFVYLYTYSINSETNCEIPCKKKPEKAWRAKKTRSSWLSWLFHVYLPLKAWKRPEKQGNSWFSWKAYSGIPRKAWRARRRLLAFKESLEFDHSRKSKKSQESQELPKMSWLSQRGWSNWLLHCKE